MIQFIVCYLSRPSVTVSPVIVVSVQSLKKYPAVFHLLWRCVCRFGVRIVHRVALHVIDEREVFNINSVFERDSVVRFAQYLDESEIS